MGLVILQIFGLVVLKICAMVIHGSAVARNGEGKPGEVFHEYVFIVAPSPVPQPNVIDAQPPLPMPPLVSMPGPQTAKSLPPSIFPSPSTLPPFIVEAPAPVMPPSNNSPPNEQTHPTAPESATTPNPHQTMGPISNAPLPNNFTSTHPPQPGNSPPFKPIPSQPPSNPPAQNAPRMLSPTRETAHHYAPVSRSPAEAPVASKPIKHPNNAPPPRLFSKLVPGFHPPTNHRHAKFYKITPAPVLHAIPPTSGFSSSTPPNPHPFPSVDDRYSPTPASPPGRASIPVVSPKHSRSGSSSRSPITRRPPPLHALPPPPPRTDCMPLTCPEPLTNGPPKSPCVCVLPIQVGLRLTVALYTFFPLVSQLATEIAAGVFMKQSQVRIMGANAAKDDPDKTIVLIDLLPLGRKFDDTTAYLTFQRFWNKQAGISTSFFGDYDVLYVRYPGLPPSPPLPPSDFGVIPIKPYPGRDNKTRTIQPLGVDISQKQHKRGFSGRILVTIIVTCLVAVILLCAVLWVLIFRHWYCASRPDPPPSNTIRSIAKSSGIPVSILGSGPSSPSFSLGSTIAACTGSSKTFTSSDIERATNFFNETRIIGEGGFGRVYSGVLEDGTKVAIKVLKKYDQQGGREFLAEVEMLSRLHHRNLVKLIGICIEDRTRCLVYELIPNGSVESHVHGVDKERSPLDWSARLKIALGAARALAYLHEDSCPRVIHRDFKASNILLEDDFTPKVSDFGLARTALDEENRHISTRVMGTFGYLAPEYAMTGHLLIKSDVYSYGVVLLELLTGRKPVDMSQPPGRENLVTWARPLLTSKEHLESIIDPSIGPDFPFENVARVAAIASMCVQPEVSHRPFMGEVVQALKLVCNECGDETQALLSKGSSHEDFSIILNAGRESARSDRLVEALLTPSSVDGYDYRLDAESEVSLSELLSSAAQAAGAQDTSASFRRYCSSSGPIKTTSKAQQMWKTMRRLSRGSVSEHGGLLKLWPGSH